MRVGEVFVAGGQPQVTYASRELEMKALEDRLSDYLEDERSVLVVTGPTKCGKTVLLRHTLRDCSGAVYVPGARMRSLEDVWGRIARELDAWTDEHRSVSRADTESSGKSWKGSLSPMNLGAGREWSAAETTTDTSLHGRSRSTALPEAAARELIKKRRPLVIDDFHHLPRDVQTAVIGAVKDLVFDGLPVILAAVPHRLADVVQSAPEMNGRVEHLPLGLWTTTELKRIATQGFGPKGMNAICSPEVADVLAHHAARSPHLMQRLCRELARENGFHETLVAPQQVGAPAGWEAFNRNVARTRTSDREIRCLLDCNPEPAGSRSEWMMSSGDAVDLHALILMAVANMGGLTEIPLMRLVQEVAARVPRDPPTKDQCSLALIRMTDTAKSIATGPNGERADPAIDFDATETQNPKLHILDAFFAFRLRWAPPFSLVAPRPTAEDEAFEQLERIQRFSRRGRENPSDD